MPASDGAYVGDSYGGATEAVSSPTADTVFGTRISTRVSAVPLGVTRDQSVGCLVSPAGDVTSLDGGAGLVTGGSV